MKMNNIILKQIRIKSKTAYFEFSVSEEIQKLFNRNIFWIEYDQEMSQCPQSILAIPFVSVMLPIMWATNSVLWVRELDYTFYEATFSLKRAYQDLYSGCALKGRLVAANLKRNIIAESDNCYSLFSGGVDAHTTFIRHIDAISNIVNIQGFYIEPQDKNSVAEADFRDIEKFAVLQNKKFDFMKSNFAVMFNLKQLKFFERKVKDGYWHAFQHSMAFISITIPLAFLHNCSKILIASSFTIGDSRVCASYPTTDNEFKFAQNGYAIHDGFELSRQDKIHVIAEHQKALGAAYPIRVCSFNDHNCCECEKCFRTILGLVAECADIEKFGFFLDKPLKEHWNNVMYQKSGLMGLSTEKLSHWPYIIERMKENYPKMNAEQKEFVDWFLTFDFEKVQRQSRLRYYKNNFFSILKRKLHLA